MNRKGKAGVGEFRPDRIEIQVTGRLVAGWLVRDPHSLEAEANDVVDLGQRVRNGNQRQGGDAHKALVSRTETCHPAVMRPGGGVLQVDTVRDFPEDGPGRESGEDELALEAELVERLA